MGHFPAKETEIVALAEQMLTGYTDHAVDFPSADTLALQASLTAYQAQKQSQEAVKSQAQIATVTKEVTLEELVVLMKNDLKLSEVDTTANPEKLLEIGWSIKAEPTPITEPNAPGDLVPVYEGDGEIKLEWGKSPRDANKPVANYIVQRRDKDSTSGEFGQWEMVEMTYTNQSHLIGQPKMREMEYRVIASNAAGESMPSNTVSVVL